MHENLAIFCFNGHKQYSAAFSAIGIDLLSPSEYKFEEGEYFFTADTPIRGKDVYLIGSFNQTDIMSTNDRLARVLFFIDTIKMMGAARITLVAPYLCYSRMERRGTYSDVLANRAVASFLQSAGLDSIVTLDVHSRGAFYSAYSIQAEALSTRFLFVNHYTNILKHSKKVHIVSPDTGGIKRAERFKHDLSLKLDIEIGFSFIRKNRNMNELEFEDTILSDIADADVIIYDDIVSTGKTIINAAKSCKKQGAAKVHVAAPHFIGLRGSNFDGNELIDEFITTNSICNGYNNALDISPMLADVVKHLYLNQTIPGLYY